jgi:predicted TIM-barrel fold metal-dependent hydrolase
VIDVAAFAGPWPWKPVGMSVTDLSSHLAHHGITHAFVTPVEGLFWEDPQPANESLAAAARGLPLSLVPAIDPTFPGWHRDLESCVNDFGSRALRIFPGYRGFAPDHPACLELLDRAGRMGIVVMVQLRMQDARMQNRLAQYPDVSLASVLGVAALFPGTRIILGGVRLGELQAAASRLRRSDAVLVETSGVEHVGGLRALIGLVGASRILFGTHTPLFLTRAALLKLEEAGLTADEAAAITEGNARRLLGAGAYGSSL